MTRVQGRWLIFLLSAIVVIQIVGTIKTEEKPPKWEYASDDVSSMNVRGLDGSNWFQFNRRRQEGGV
jgi:hypothetical protein